MGPKGFRWPNLCVMVALSLMGLTLAACGYQLAGMGQLPGGVNRLAIAVLANRTIYSALQTTITNALIDEFSHRRPGLIVSLEQAEAVLSGTILSMESETVSRATTQAASGRHVVIRVALTLTNKAGQILWQDPGLRFEQAYAVSSNKITSDANRQEAMDKAAGRLAEYVYERLTDAF